MNIESLLAITQTSQYFEVFQHFLFSSVALQLFIHFYLLIKNAIDRSIFFARYLPAEILGRFRDYTKKEKSPLHFLYYVQLVLVVISILLFSPIAFADIEFSNPIVRIVSIPLFITVILMGYLMCIQLFDRYYK